MPPVEEPPEARLGCRSEARAPRGAHIFVDGSLTRETGTKERLTKSVSYEDVEDTLTLQYGS